MKIGVVSRTPTFWSTKRLLRSIEKHGHESSFLKTDDIRLLVGGRDDAIYQGKSIRHHGVLIPRIGRTMTEFGGMLLRELERLGVRMTLQSEALLTARNKFLALQALREAKVPVPRSVLLGSRPDLEETADLITYPAVVKILSGTQGVGVLRVNNIQETASIVETLKFLGEAVLLQEFIPNPGEDVRVLVVGDRVVAAMKRIAPPKEWRANIHRGGRGVPIDLDETTEKIAIRASQAVGLEISGVDMIFRGDKPVVLEVNVSPGFRGLLEATGINAADAMVQYAIDKAKT